MEARSTALRYGSVAQALHWATVVLVIAAYAMSPGGNEQRVYSEAADFGRRVHETLGATVLVVAFVRLAWRAIDATPDDPPMPAWMHATARAFHWLLYGLLLAIPFTAITGAWLEGHPLTFIGGLDLAPLLAKSHDAGKSIAWIHGWLGNAVLWLAGVHAAAALYHHFVLKDRVLASMLPLR